MKVVLAIHYTCRAYGTYFMFIVILDNRLRSIYSGSGVLFVLKRVFVSFPFRFRFAFVAFRF